jgi:hypothetical protein
MIAREPVSVRLSKSLKRRAPFANKAQASAFTSGSPEFVALSSSLPASCCPNLHHITPQRNTSLPSISVSPPTPRNISGTPALSCNHLFCCSKLQSNCQQQSPQRKDRRPARVCRPRRGSDHRDAAVLHRAYAHSCNWVTGQMTLDGRGTRMTLTGHGMR